MPHLEGPTEARGPRVVVMTAGPERCYLRAQVRSSPNHPARGMRPFSSGGTVHVTRSRLLLASLVLVAMASTATADEDALSLIRKAIQEKGAAWTAGPNPIWNLPPEQRRALLGWDPSREERWPVPQAPTDVGKHLPPSFDWRNVNGESYVTPIRNQGQCGSCWAFGALACVESRMAIDAFVPNPTVDLSEQYLVSCSPGSCNGYSLSGTCEFLQTEGTITEACMPYRAVDTVPCSNHCPSGPMEVVKIQYWGWIPIGDRNLIKAHVLEGPVYVAFIVYSDFMAYQGGVYEHVWGEQEGGHAVAIVGWDDGQQCWICKNSWGDWGEGGYFRIRYGQCMMEFWCIWMSVAPPSYPNLSVSPVTLVEVMGDGDGVANPGEHATLSFRVMASPYWAAATSPTITLSSPSQAATVVQATATLPSLLPGDTVQCEGDLVVALDSQGPVAPISVSLSMSAPVEGMPPYQKTVSAEIEPSLTQAGYPLLGGTTIYANPTCIPWGDSVWVVAADRWGAVTLLGASGTPLAGWPVSLGDAVRGAPAVADLNGDGTPEVVVGSRAGVLAALKVNGQPLWQADLGSGILATPMVAQLDGNPGLEVVAGTIGGLLWILRSDGSPVPGWPRPMGSPLLSGAALVEAAEPALVVGTRSGWLHLLTPSGDERPGWPVNLQGEIWTDPVVADVDNDGQWEVVCAARGVVSLVELDGTVRPLHQGSSVVRSALLTLDLNGDAVLEVVFATSDLKLHAVSPSGPLPGWPRQLQGSSTLGLAAADLDGEGLPEVLCATDGGLAWFLDNNGTTLSPSPVTLHAPAASPPSLADLDGDGDLELLVGTTDGLTALDHKAKGVRPCWPTHRVNLARTGVYVRDTAPSEPALPRHWVVSPVPARDHVVVGIPSSPGEGLSLYLFDMGGRLVMTQRVRAQGDFTRLALPLTSLPPGAYTLRVGGYPQSLVVVRLP